MATVNPWKRFIGLLPGGSRAVGQVLSISTASATSILQLRNGVQIQASGVSVPVSQNAFIVDGVITGPAPSLPQYDVEV